MDEENDQAQSIVLEEEIDENYEPTEEEIHEYATWLGMDLVEEKELIWIAAEGLKAPLPQDWKPCRSPEGDIYYFNFTTGESVWDHPCDEYYRKLYQEEKKKLADKVNKGVEILKPLSSSPQSKKLKTLDRTRPLAQVEEAKKKSSPIKSYEERVLNKMTDKQVQPSQDEQSNKQEVESDSIKRQDFALKLEKERIRWEKEEQEALEEFKKNTKLQFEKEMEDLKEDFGKKVSKEKETLEKDHEKVISDLKTKHLSTEEKMKADHDSSLEKRKEKMKEEESKQVQIFEDKHKSLKEEHEKILMRENEKFEKLNKEKKQKEKDIKEELESMKSKHSDVIEEKKKELELQLEKELQDLRSSKDLSKWVEDEMVQKRAAYEIEIKETIDKEREEKMTAQREQLEKELTSLRQAHNEKVQKLEEKLQVEIAVIEDDFNQRKLKELQTLEDKYQSSIEEKTSELENRSKEQIDRIREEQLAYEIEAQQEAELEKTSVINKFKEEALADIEQAKKSHLQKLEDDLKTFKDKKNIEFERFKEQSMQAHENELRSLDKIQKSEIHNLQKQIETEEVPSVSNVDKVVEDEVQISEAVPDADADADMKEVEEEILEGTPIRIALHQKEERKNQGSRDSEKNVSYSIMSKLIKDQKHFLVERKHSLQRARKEWKDHFKALQDQKYISLQNPQEDLMLLMTAKEALEVQTRRLNEDARNFRVLKEEVEKAWCTPEAVNDEEKEQDEEREAQIMNFVGNTFSTNKEDSTGQSDVENTFEHKQGRQLKRAMRNRLVMQHDNALKALNGHSAWLSNLKDKLSQKKKSISLKPTPPLGQKPKFIYTSGKDVVIRISHV